MSDSPRLHRRIVAAVCRHQAGRNRQHEALELMLLEAIEHVVKALALGFAASMAIFYFGMTQAKSDSDKELAAAMRVAIAVGVLVALGVWL